MLHEPNRARAAEYYRAALESTPDAGFTVEAATSDQASNLEFNKYALRRARGHDRSRRRLHPKRRRSARCRRTESGCQKRSARHKDQRHPLCISGNERFFAAADVDEAIPSVARAGKFDDVKFYQVVRIDAGKDRVLAKLTDGTPLLVEKKIGAGRLLIFASTFDNIANDLPLHASFVPFVEQSALYLSGGGILSCAILRRFLR